eukprot:5602256-Pyramimonas_sp.AAC.1
MALGSPTRGGGSGGRRALREAHEKGSSGFHAMMMTRTDPFGHSSAATPWGVSPWPEFPGQGSPRSAPRLIGVPCARRRA